MPEYLAHILHSILKHPVSLIFIGVMIPVALFQFDSNLVPLRELWLIICAILILSGIYRLVQNRKKRKEDQQEATSRLANIVDLKLFGYKVKVTADNSEIKTRSYEQEVINDHPETANYLDHLYDPNRTHETKRINQSYIVFFTEIKGTKYKFISEPVFIDNQNFRLAVLEQNGIDLFVDKTNPNNYFFDLEKIKTALFSDPP